MIVIKAPAGFDPTWPAVPVDQPRCVTCAGQTRYKNDGWVCPETHVDLAALLGPKDADRCPGCAARCESCVDAIIRVPQRVALAIETRCDACDGYGRWTEPWPTPSGMREIPASCDECDGVGRRLRVEYTAQVDAVVPIVSLMTDNRNPWPCVIWTPISLGVHLENGIVDFDLPSDPRVIRPGWVAVLISDVRQLGVGDMPLYAPTMMDVRPFDGPVAELSEVLA